MAKQKNGWKGGRVPSDHAECLRVLDEFVGDIEAVVSDPNCETVEITWPDLWITYLKARKLVRDD